MIFVKGGTKNPELVTNEARGPELYAPKGMDSDLDRFPMCPNLEFLSLLSRLINNITDDIHQAIGNERAAFE